MLGHSDSLWAPTRAEALRRLDKFVPHAGSEYTRSRNFDHGPADRSNVSTLSPYISHRLIREDEVLGAVLDRFSYRQCEKFVQEVCWRTYWKGWLESRPEIWSDYRIQVAQMVDRFDHDQGCGIAGSERTEGQTDIACFDSWSVELVETGYLHNHTRMWFASIWIFTLGLPWSLGADFFLRHLLDGDPASNTLSWRWVAGLHTTGKTYLARPANIARYTSGRFEPNDVLARRATAIESSPLPAPRRLGPPDKIDDVESGVLLTEDDLDAASLGLEQCSIRAVAGVLATGDRSPLGVGRLALQFAQGAMDDALERASEAFAAPAQRLAGSDWDAVVVDWASRHSLQQVITAFVPQGPSRDQLDRLGHTLSQVGVRLVRVRRPWDEAFWPHATRGFFSLKSHIPAIIHSLGLTS